MFNLHFCTFYVYLCVMVQLKVRTENIYGKFSIRKCASEHVIYHFFYCCKNNRMLISERSSD